MDTLIASLAADWQANRGNPKGRCVVVGFRLCSWVRALPAPFWWIGIPLLVSYLLIVVWIMGIELGYRTRVGKGLALHHGTGLVINEQCVLGENCILRHCTTIGNTAEGGPCPTLGDRVEVGANAVILGGVHIGDGARIGAGAVVLHDVPPGATAVGNPARTVLTSGPV